MLRILRLLAVLLVIALAGFAIVGVANDRKLGGAGFYSGLDELLKRAAAVREAASPEYQHEVLGSLPTNATAGPVLRLDDHIAEARIVDEPVRNDALAGFEHVFTYDFDTPDELVSAQGMLKPTVRDGVLVVEHVKDDYLHNARPIEIVTDDVGEIIVRAKATKGTHFTLAWSPMAKPELWLRYRVDIPLIADGKFHNYSINARNALRRGLDEGKELHFIALQPSDVPGDRVEVDFIRFLSTHSKYLRKPRDVSYESVAGEMRPVMSMLPRQTLEFSARVPSQDPRMSFGTAVIGKDSRIRFSVQVVSDSNTTELHNETVEAPGAWHDASYDLRQWAGKDVALRLSVDGEPGSVGVWSSPTLYGRPPQPLRVMIILEDALRADRLSLYGHDHKTSPFKEELLQTQGAVFLRARSQDNVTRTSLPSMMTSLLPSVTGVWGFADMLRPEFLTLAEVLRQQGYATGSFVQNSNAGPASALQQGFDTTIDEEAHGTTEKLLQGEQLWNWLRSHRDRNTFVYLHIVDPHGPYEPPAPFDEAYRTLEPGSGPVVQRVDSLDADYVQQPTAATRAALYDGEIRNNDDKLRGFFDRMKAEGLFDDTLFIFTADHGEYLGEHGYFAHNPPGYVQNTGVPLIVYHKQKIPQQLRVDEPVQLLDIMPTVLDFANVDTSGMVMQGDSLLGLIEGRDRGYWKSRVIASEEVTTRDRTRSWRNTGLRVCGSLFYGDWHFISSRSFWPHSGFVPESLRLKVFNQAEDPQETQALSRFFADAYLRYRFTAGLDELQSLGEDAQRRFRSTQEINYEFDPDTLEHLKALGYVE
ncbi:MAG TPA: sulfatase [Steroidobacteraceae bacterium]|nr:sulfatase [Steroidobacteraceae bacterium]